MRKAAFFICKNKGTDQPLGYCQANCFCYIDSSMTILPKSEISSLKPSFVAIQPDLCLTWSATLKTDLSSYGSVRAYIYGIQNIGDKMSRITRKPLFLHMKKIGFSHDAVHYIKVNAIKII